MRRRGRSLGRAMQKGRATPSRWVEGSGAKALLLDDWLWERRNAAFRWASSMVLPKLQSRTHACLASA